MFNRLKKELYFSKCQLLFQKGLNDGKIVPFDEEFYKLMSTTYVSCIPVSMHIKYFKPILPPGKCYDRSLYMFFCFDDALLFRGDQKDLELKFGKEDAEHGWIEIGNYVYDPSLMLRFDKDLYYKIYVPTNIQKYTKEEYCSRDGNKKLYHDVKNTTIDDFLPGGSRRCDLMNIIPNLKGIADNSLNEQFQKEVDQWLKTIKYDELEIQDELDRKLEKIINFR